MGGLLRGRRGLSGRELALPPGADVGPAVLVPAEHHVFGEAVARIVPVDGEEWRPAD